MSIVIFSYNSNEIKIPCKNEEKMKEICKRFELKTGNNINELFFFIWR